MRKACKLVNILDILASFHPLAAVSNIKFRYSGQQVERCAREKVRERIKTLEKNYKGLQSVCIFCSALRLSSFKGSWGAPGKSHMARFIGTFSNINDASL